MLISQVLLEAHLGHDLALLWADGGVRLGRAQIALHHLCLRKPVVDRRMLLGFSFIGYQHGLQVIFKSGTSAGALCNLNGVDSSLLHLFRSLM